MRDQRQVRVLFVDPLLKPIVISLRAHVVPDLAVSPVRLTLRNLTSGKPAEAFFDVSNFTDRDWSSISAEPDVEWIGTRIMPIPLLDPRPQPLRQKWRVVVRLDTRALAPGSATAAITVSAPDGTCTTVPVQVNLQPLIAVFPSELFFGMVRPGERLARTITFRFSSDAPNKVDHPELTHTLGDQLELTWTRASPRIGLLTAHFRSNGAHELARGDVNARFPGTSLPSITIPVRAWVQSGAFE